MKTGLLTCILINHLVKNVQVYVVDKPTVIGSLGLRAGLRQRLIYQSAEEVTEQHDPNLKQQLEVDLFVSSCLIR